MSWFRKEHEADDQGFSVQSGRDWLVYRRGNRKMTITVDSGAGQINVFTDTVGRWDDDPSTRVSESECEVIVRDISNTLRQKGLTVRLMP